MYCVYMAIMLISFRNLDNEREKRRALEGKRPFEFQHIYETNFTGSDMGRTVIF